MEFTIKRTSRRSGDEAMGSYLKELGIEYILVRPRYYNALNEDKTSEYYEIHPHDGKTYDCLVTVKTLEGFSQFIKKFNCEIIIDDKFRTIEIYDDYRE